MPVTGLMDPIFKRTMFRDTIYKDSEPPPRLPPTKPRTRDLDMADESAALDAFAAARLPI